MKDSVKHWQLCKIGENDTPEWNGIVHLPTWKAFKIDGKAAQIVLRGKPLKEAEERRLADLAMKWFFSGAVSTRHHRFYKDEWELVGNRTMLHSGGVGFEMWACGEVLTAIPTYYKDKALIFSSDVEELKKIAARAFRNAIGMRRNARKAVPN